MAHTNILHPSFAITLCKLHSRITVAAYQIYYSDFLLSARYPSMVFPRMQEVVAFVMTIAKHPSMRCYSTHCLRGLSNSNPFFALLSTHLLFHCCKILRHQAHQQPDCRDIHCLQFSGDAVPNVLTHRCSRPHPSLILDFYV